MMLLILAMVLSAAAVKAYEQGKARSKARWEDAKRRAEERGAARERARQQSAAEWERRWNDALSAGPRRALWWAYAGGYLAGGAVMALGAGAVGVYSGAVAGGRSGYRIGIEAGTAGRRYGEAFQAWRRANRGHGEPIELAVCGRCKGWIAKSELVADAKHGLVCPDCVPDAASEPDGQDRSGGATNLPPPCANRCGMRASAGSRLCALCLIEELNRLEREAERADAEHRRTCPGNSNLGPDEAIARGLCPCCGGNSELITDFGGEHKHVTCPECNGSGKYRRAYGPRDGFKQPTCACGRQTTGGPRCDVCAAQYRKTGKDSAEQKQGPIRVTAERIYPEQEEEPQPKEIGNTMTTLEPASTNTVDTSGEGYASTVAGLESLAQLMNQVFEKVTDLTDQLTANSLDADTLTRLNEMTDGIESVASQAAALHKHVVGRHEALAGATAEAGGSQNVATKTFYDNY